MFEINGKKIEINQKNITNKKNISLDENLECFILVSSNNIKLIDTIMNNIIDSILDKISIENTYNDFSIALENINSFLKTIKEDVKGEEIKLDLVIAILNEDKFMFSNIGESNILLVKNDNEILELSDKNEIKTEFTFIQDGILKQEEIVVLSNKRILNYLTKVDLTDGLNNSRDIEIFGKNIKNILKSEILEDNILLTNIKYKRDLIENQIIGKNIFSEFFNKIKNLEIVEKISEKIKKNENIKKIKEKISCSSKDMKNIIFITGIIISFILIYQILSAIIGVATNSSIKENVKNEILQAKQLVRIASESINDKNNFELNIQNATEIINNIKEKKLFLNDIEKINDSINILKKQFNKVEIFELNENNTIFSGDLENSVKILKVDKKPYIITKKGITGPILPNIKPKNYIFSKLESNEYFIDAVNIGNEIIILTNFSNIVNFSKNGYFSYADVIGQETWNKSKSINSYADNIYLVSKDKNQILKHTKNGKNFKKSTPYLKNDDLKQIGEIIDIAIDGSFYILKKDLSIIKFYNSPKYRLENLVINKLPDNYKNEDESKKIELKTRSELKYVYMLLNNKIWIFKPNTNDYKSTKSLNYIGQIESPKSEIINFFVNYDGEIIILNNKGIHKLNFEISDDKLILR